MTDPKWTCSCGRKHRADRRKCPACGAAKEETSAPSFAAVDSQAKAEKLARDGTLARLLLLPEAFGGSDDPRNVIYVPPWVVEVKTRMDSTVIGALVAQGKVQRYAAEPAYEGKSFVPASITIRAWDPADFSQTIHVWGPGAAAR